MKLKEDIEKIGNTIVYLSQNIPNLSKTKLLKILYLLDEYSVKTTGIPFLNLRYEVWKFGPVSQEIFVDIESDELTILKEFINVTVDSEGRKYVQSKVEFNDDEFTNKEIEFLINVTNAFRDKTAAELVNITHAKGSLWYNTAKINGLIEDFEQGLTNSSNIELDFRDLIQHDEKKLTFYNDYLNIKGSFSSLKSH